VKTIVSLLIKVWSENPLQKRNDRLSKISSPSHPLVKVSPRVVVRPKKPSAGKIPFDPPKERLVDHMELQGNLGLATITAKVPLPNEKTDKHAKAKVGGGRIDQKVRIEIFWCDSSRRQTHREIGLLA
jgi:hypothetical protein